MPLSNTETTDSSFRMQVNVILFRDGTNPMANGNMETKSNAIHTTIDEITTWKGENSTNGGEEEFETQMIHNSNPSILSDAVFFCYTDMLLFPLLSVIYSVLCIGIVTLLYYFCLQMEDSETLRLSWCERMSWQWEDVEEIKERMMKIWYVGRLKKKGNRELEEEKEGPQNPTLIAYLYLSNWILVSWFHLPFWFRFQFSRFNAVSSWLYSLAVACCSFCTLSGFPVAVSILLLRFTIIPNAVLLCVCSYCVKLLCSYCWVLAL